MRLHPLFIAASCTLFGTSALALEQPDGTPIPQKELLRDYLDGEGESIDPRTAAAITPQTFDPNCQLTFKVIARGGGQRNSFGWYNVTGQRPELSDLHEFLTCTDGVGTERVLDIKNHPAYRGGRIGFFMATTEGKNPPNCVSFTDGVGPDPSTLGYLYFSEPQYNDDNEGPDSFIHLIVMDSGAYPQAFYFGWEDLFGGGDNDFEDLLTRVEGITCAGGGAACETGLPGICNAGTEQCHNGALACMPQMQPRDEICNGLDDDCDGSVDEGDDLCESGEVCSQGQCVYACVGGEFACKDGYVCNDRNVCVVAACADVDCPAGEICHPDGVCRAPCDGVSCPIGKVCRIGRCVDPCDGVVCDAGQVCDEGVCRNDCDCTPCPDGEVCTPDGTCVKEACAGVECGDGTVCVVSPVTEVAECVDPCTGAVCPAGETCVEGACVPGGGSGGSGGSGGTSGGSGGSGGNASGGSGGAGAGGSGGTDSSGGSGRGDGRGGGKSGGGCSSAGGAAAFGFAAAAFALVRRRR